MTLSKRTAKGWEGGSGSDSEGGALLPVSARAPGPPPPARRLGARAASVAVAALALFGVAVYALGTPARHAAAGLLAPEPSPQFVTVRGEAKRFCRKPPTHNSNSQLDAHLNSPLASKLLTLQTGASWTAAARSRL
jgi:hypothetical protein